MRSASAHCCGWLLMDVEFYVGAGGLPGRGKIGQSLRCNCSAEVFLELAGRGFYTKFISAMLISIK